MRIKLISRGSCIPSFINVLQGLIRIQLMCSVASHLSRWRESLPSTCKLCGETEVTSLHLWGECPAQELERIQLPCVRNGGRHNNTPHRLILGFFKHEKIRGLMYTNSEWLEESDPDDPPTQSEDEGGRTPFPPPKRRPL